MPNGFRTDAPRTRASRAARLSVLLGILAVLPTASLSAATGPTAAPPFAGGPRWYEVEIRFTYIKQVRLEDDELRQPPSDEGAVLNDRSVFVESWKLRTRSPVRLRNRCQPLFGGGADPGDPPLAVTNCKKGFGYVHAAWTRSSALRGEVTEDRLDAEWDLWRTVSEGRPGGQPRGPWHWEHCGKVTETRRKLGRAPISGFLSGTRGGTLSIDVRGRPYKARYTTSGVTCPPIAPAAGPPYDRPREHVKARTETTDLGFLPSGSTEWARRFGDDALRDFELGWGGRFGQAKTLNVHLEQERSTGGATAREDAEWTIVLKPCPDRGRRREGC